MTRQQQIQKVSDELSQVWKLIQDLENDGIPADHSVFDLLANRLNYLMNGFCFLVEKYPECRLHSSAIAHQN